MNKLTTNPDTVELRTKTNSRTTNDERAINSYFSNQILPPVQNSLYCDELLEQFLFISLIIEINKA